jgi:hypothetical protein
LRLVPEVFCQIAISHIAPFGSGNGLGDQPASNKICSFFRDERLFLFYIMWSHCATFVLSLCSCFDSLSMDSRNVKGGLYLASASEHGKEIHASSSIPEVVSPGAAALNGSNDNMEKRADVGLNTRYVLMETCD